jgi:hypothetical protein
LSGLDLLGRRTVLLTQWILSLLLTIAPPGSTPRENADDGLTRYVELSGAIADVVANEEPLFGGPLGRERTAATLVATAWMESGFRVDVARGETRGDLGKACSYWQIQAPPVRCAEFVKDRRAEVSYALSLMRRSFAATRTLPLDDRLRVFASGRTDSGGESSKARMQAAKRLFARVPPITRNGS